MSAYGHLLMALCKVRLGRAVAVRMPPGSECSKGQNSVTCQQKSATSSVKLPSGSPQGRGCRRPASMMPAHANSALLSVSLVLDQHPAEHCSGLGHTINMQSRC